MIFSCTSSFQEKNFAQSRRIVRLFNSIDDSQPEDLEIVHQDLAGETPDRLALGNDGRLYVALAFSHQLSVLLPDIGEVGPIASMPGDAAPLENPEALAFH